MTNRYGIMTGGLYLKARFGFEFTEAATPEIQGIQDALLSQASEVARQRMGLLRLMQSMEEDFSFMSKALECGSLYVPLGEGPTRDPYAAARRIEREEQALKLLCAAVAKLQGAGK